MSMTATPMTDPVSAPRLLAGLAIDYFRWTQLVPMITAWTFLVVMVGAMLLVNFQQQSFALVDRGITAYERVFGPIAIDTEAEALSGSETSVPLEEAEGGAVTFSDEDFMPWVLKAWGVLALAGWVLGMLLTAVFGPREPMRLKRKLALAAIPAVVCTALFAVAYFFGTEEFHGSAMGWMLMFTGFPLGVWLVSAYSLAVAHGLDMLRTRVVDPA